MDAGRPCELELELELEFAQSILAYITQANLEALEAREAPRAVVTLFVSQLFVKEAPTGKTSLSF